MECESPDWKVSPHTTPLTARADGDDDDLIKERWRSLLYYRWSDIDMLAGVVLTGHSTLPYISLAVKAHSDKALLCFPNCISVSQQ